MILSTYQTLRARSARKMLVLGLGVVLSGCAAQQASRDSLSANFGGTENVADVALDSGNPEIALHVANAVLSHKPKDPTALVLASSASWQMGRMPQAKSYAERAVAIAPNDVAALMALGRALDHSHPGKAMAAFGKAYAMAPRELAVAVDYGVACIQNGLPEKGIAILAAAVQAHPDSSDARYNLALAYAVSNRPGNAMKGVEILGNLAHQPDAPVLYVAAYDYAAKIAGMPTDRN